ncbi:actin filament-coating protein tropomyosin [Phaffia rhodozyma]|uniref:Actin filament-coating protein tropomyosin n=1 Tax=Phaffia rhodozyma TaxID=264483 RepID=A0A0F7SF62_PHARH|nr:actin filament-coating protein tropomyosin [Phaffia rhodozyma]
MDAIKNKLKSLRDEADASLARAEEAETKNKQYEQDVLTKDQEIASLSRKVQLLEEDLEKAEGKLSEAKDIGEEFENHKGASENMSRKLQLLEEELDTAEKNLKETVEKLRQVDVKAEHFERQITRVEQERDNWEKKYEEALAQYKESKRELDEVVAQMESL